MDALLNNPLAWLLPILVPLGAAPAVLWPRSRTVAEHVAPWTAAPALLLALICGAARSVDVPWLLLGSRLGLDDISRALLFFSAVLWLASGVFASGYLANNRRRYRFTFFFLLAMSGNFGLILAQDMALFYVGFALMSFASYGLVVFNRDNEALRAGRVYIVLVVFGELLLFSGLAVAASATGSIIWCGLGDRLADTAAGNAAMLLLFSGLAVKAGALPLHVWLPLAHPAAPVPASAVLSGAMIKAGLLGWLRLVPSDASAALSGWGELCLILGVAGAFYGVAVGLTQSNAKMLLAYSSISQMGLITVALGLAFFHPQALTAAVAYAMHHGLAKGALFLGVGVAAVARRTALQRWLCGLGLLFPALALAGMPLTSGALAKAMLKSSTGAAPGLWSSGLGWLLPLAAVGTTLLMARFLWLTWPTPASASGEASRRVWLSWSTLLVVVALGVFLWPWSARVHSVPSLLLPPGVLSATWPVIAGALLAAVVAATAARGYRLPAPVIPAGDILVPAVASATAVWHLSSRSVRHLATRLPRKQLLEWRDAVKELRYPGLSHLLDDAPWKGPVIGVVLLAMLATLLGLMRLS